MTKRESLKQKNKNLGANQLAQGYIVSVTADFWMAGGLSMLTMFFLVVYFSISPVSAQTSIATMGGMLILQALINWPHFLGAYSLLYRSRSQIKLYKTATLLVPAILLFVLFISINASDKPNNHFILIDQKIAYFVWLLAAFYLAWHYTGQSWGLIVSFSLLSKTGIRETERLIIRLGIKTLIAWHVIWGAQDLPADWFFGFYGYLPWAQALINIVCISSFFVGAVVWYLIYWRQGALDKRVLIVWLSIYTWYLVLYFYPKAYPFVQLSHALQYLMFPLRVELNKRLSSEKPKKISDEYAWIAKYAIFLVFVGVVLFWVPEYFSDKSQTFTLASMIAALVAIHHYFVDSCIWKISNPTVRQQLFAHLPKTK